MTIFARQKLINPAKMNRTISQFEAVLKDCKSVFKDKSGDYGPSWRVLRPTTLTDQLLIKARRIRQLETSGKTAVGEGMVTEFKALVNYGIMAVIQLRNGYSDTKDMTTSDALDAYNSIAEETKKLMVAKNTDYSEAWREMRISSYTDLILAKLERIKEIENNSGQVAVSEGIDSNYFDIINYAIFALIRFSEAKNKN